MGHKKVSIKAKYARIQFLVSCRNFIRFTFSGLENELKVFLASVELTSTHLDNNPPLISFKIFFEFRTIFSGTVNNESSSEMTMKFYARGSNRWNKRFNSLPLHDANYVVLATSFTSRKTVFNLLSIPV